MCYQGMDLLIAGGGGNATKLYPTRRPGIYLICPRTHFVYQSLPFPSVIIRHHHHQPSTNAEKNDDTKDEPEDDHQQHSAAIFLLSIQSHPMTGLICVAYSNGTIQTYYPLPNDPTIHIHGQYHWELGPTISAPSYFTNWQQTMSSSSLHQEMIPFDMSLSYQNKVLVAYQNQLAVFDIRRTDSASNTIWTAELVWMTQVSKYIRTAKISGDGNAIAVVLRPKTPPQEEENDAAENVDDDSQDEAATDGIYTYEREKIDPNHPPQSMNLNLPDGVWYQPGPFLVHHAPVTHLSFRGYGNLTSTSLSSTMTTTGALNEMSPPPPPQQSNDLLLSYCSSDCTVRIYGQNAWNPLTEWVTPVGTRVDFIQCTSSMTIGDFLSPQSDTNHNSSSSSSSHHPKSNPKSRSPYKGNDHAGNDATSPTRQQQYPSDPSRDTYGQQRVQIPTIPNHFPIPPTLAGAWIYELSVPPQLLSSDGLPQISSPPSLRISRLTYLERGIDDLNPTLLECIASYIPISSCFIGEPNRQHVLDHPSAFSVHGIWPAWNPFLSNTTATSEQKNRHHFSPNSNNRSHTIDTVPGSAMAYLGLSSGPSTGNTNVTGLAGYFGAHGSLGGTQCPPCEIRISVGHAIAGQVTLMDFSIFGDKALTQVTLGNPRRNILSLAHMNEGAPIQISPRHRKEIIDRTKSIVRSSMSYEMSRLTAEVQPDSKTISVLWQKPGTMSFVPINWLPEDLEPTRAVAMLQNSANSVTDESLIPVPLVLPSLHINTIELAIEGDATIHICALLWWPDHKYNGSPMLMAILSTGTIVLFEVPPPFCVSELSIPNNGRPLPPSMSMDLHGLSPSQSYDNSINGDDNDSQTSSPSTEYEVVITPDPEFGLGLRLEAPPNGIGAFVGSFKRHPLSGDALPAETCGRIRIDDDLLSANDIDLESKAFDEIVTAVREISASCGPGNPIRMKLRRSAVVKNKSASVLTAIHTHKSTDSHSVERRSMEKMLGVSPASMRRKGKPGKPRSRPEDSNEKQTYPNDNDYTKIKDQNPSNLYAVAGIYRHAVRGFDEGTTPFDAKSNCIILTLNQVDENLVDRAAILISSNSTSVVATLLNVPNENEKVEAESILLGSHRIRCESSSTSDSSICALSMTEGTFNSHTFVVCVRSGEVHLTTMTIELSDSVKDTAVAFQSFYLFKLESPWSSGSVLKAYSSTLIATMQCRSDSDGTCDVIKIWSASPTPGCKLDDSTQVDESSSVESSYFGIDVYTEHNSDRDFFYDFEFVLPGTLDSMPSLVTYSSTRARLLQKYRGGQDWVPSSYIVYNTKFWEGSMHQAGRAGCIYRTFAPHDNFPHIVYGLRSMHSSQGEHTILSSDWHSASLLSSICGSLEGPKITLSSNIRSVLLWLCSDPNEQDNQGIGTLTVAPLPLHNKKTNHDVADRPNDIMAALTSRTKENPGDVLIRNFLSSLRAYIETISDESRKSVGDNLAPSQGNSTPSSYSSLAPILLTMSVVDLRTLWIIGDMVLDPPQFDDLDNPAQLYLFSNAFMEKWRACMQQVAPGTGAPTRRSMPSHGVVIRSASSASGLVTDSYESIPSSGTLAALLSCDQVLLMRTIRASSPRITWQFVRERRIAFWERSTTSLALLAEEIGSGIFLESRDVMESSLFYILSKKITTLQNLAKSDQSTTGRTFAKFLTDYDFSTERGRRAAEKNAFSLLRKCRYQVAAAFFLLADPPFLTAALETIATKMNDVDLAFFVARLTETTVSGLSRGSLPAGFGSVIGGGGGYAGVGTDYSGSAKARFEEWKPNLGTESRKLLIERILPATSNDSMMTAVSLLWLEKNNEAAWFVSRIVQVSYAGLTTYSTRNDASQNLAELFNRFTRNRYQSRQQLSWLTLTNAVIDFVSAAPLLKVLGAGSRVMYASSLVVSRALSTIGCELCSIRNLLDLPELLNVDNGGSDLGDVGKKSCDVVSALQNQVAPNAGIMTSSIFDDFSIPPSQIAPKNPNTTETSIFDDFDILPPPPKVRADPTYSSIFDDFIGPPTPHKGPEVASNRGSTEIRSSIFDNFDVPRHRPNLAPGTTTLPNANQSDTSHSSDAAVDVENTIQLQISLNIQQLAPPKLWDEWRKAVLLESVSKRLLREIATVVNQFHGDVDKSSIGDLYQNIDYLKFSRVSEILIVNCDSTVILGKIRQSLDDLVMTSKIDLLEIVEHAHAILGYSHCQRIVFSVILVTLIRRDDLAEDIMRESASRLMQNCNNFSMLYDDAARTQGTIGYISSLFSRRDAARISWQLETCLWIHRGGGLKLSNDAIKECAIAVRLGILTASWKREFDCIDAMIFNDSDCTVDEDAGHQVWSSLKDIDVSKMDNVELSEGWEFLVECKRSQATDLLRDAPPGCFLIRPHADDDGVFTLSFKTNLNVASSDVREDSVREDEIFTPDTSADELSDFDNVEKSRHNKKKKVRKDDVVQHAIVRLSDSGFRCGSFGPFASLISLLETVSASLPFQLRFDMPPKHKVIKAQKRLQTSPNAIFLRKLSLHKTLSPFAESPNTTNTYEPSYHSDQHIWKNELLDDNCLTHTMQRSSFGMFSQLMMLSLLRRQLCSIATSTNEQLVAFVEDNGGNEQNQSHDNDCYNHKNKLVAMATRVLHPLLTWCQLKEIATASFLSPDLLYDWSHRPTLSSTDTIVGRPDKVKVESVDAIEVSPLDNELYIEGGDSVLRSMIRQESGIEFSTLRLVDAGECTMLVLFSRHEAIRWLISSGLDETEESAINRLNTMERLRVIERVDVARLTFKLKNTDPKIEDVRYRFVDPWEVEPLKSRDSETQAASLGRERYVGFNLGQILTCSETALRHIGGVALMELWSVTKCSLLLTKAIAASYPPWEKGCIGDLQLTNGKVTEPPPFVNSIRRCLFRNSLYRRLDLPQRFIAIIQVELMDLKNLTTPGGSLSLTAYALLRLKRIGSSGILTNKARTIDSASTSPIKLNKTSGPNAPASWGSIVSFRFALPEVADGANSNHTNNRDRETLFKGPPRVLQISVYEKKMLADHAIGSADVNMDGLSSGGQIEEWVPLRSEKLGTISWFSRIRISLRFEIMNLAPNHVDANSIPSVGLQRIEELTHKSGGSIHEDSSPQHHQRSLSSSDL